MIKLLSNIYLSNELLNIRYTNEILICPQLNIIYKYFPNKFDWKKLTIKYDKSNELVIDWEFVSNIEFIDVITPIYENIKYYSVNLDNICYKIGLDIYDNPILILYYTYDKENYYETNINIYLNESIKKFDILDKYLDNSEFIIYDKN